jgi:hypothetical protein
MEQWFVFNGVRILLTTGAALHEIQSWPPWQPEVILSICRDQVRVLHATVTVLHDPE